MSIFYRNLLLLLIIFMVLGMLFVGLYPFNFFPENRVSVNEDGSGIHFYGRGIAYIANVGDWPRKGPITLELVIKPERTYNHRVPHIMSLCDRSGHEVIYLGQWEDSLIVRLVKERFWIERVQREVGVDHLLRRGAIVHLHLVLDRGGMEIYANGQKVHASDSSDFTTAILKRPVHSIILGNASTGDSAWRGKILGFNILKDRMDPSSIQNRYGQWSTGPGQGIKGLTIPPTFTPIRREFLSPSTLKNYDERSFYKDAIINVAGFVPLGLALAVLFSDLPLRKHAPWAFFLPVLMGGLLSLTIETGQTFLLSRSSSVIDLVLNITGSGIGALVYGGWKKFLNFKFHILRDTHNP